MKLLKFIILITFCSCTHSKESDPIIQKESEYFTAIQKNDIKLTEPKKGEWRFEHNEKFQTFEIYKSQNPKRLSDSQNVIYLKPIGQFTDLQNKALELTRQYLSIFFQTETILLPCMPDTLIPKRVKRLRENNNLQILAPYVLDTLLINQVPKNSIAYMAITAKDLYPKNEWNFLFGLASYTRRVGVSSIYRLQNKNLDSSNFILCLKRLINVSSHEIGHMFTFHHCIAAKCVMNGSNSLHETDLIPNRLCGECQKKLFWNIRYNNKKRLRELCSFFETNNLQKDYEILNADLKQF